MKRKFELLAPGGGVDAIKAAIAAGADAVYCGLEKFSARDRAANVPISDIHGVVRLAHENRCRVYITLNTIIVENEIPSVLRLLNKLVNTHVDGVIVQDIGLAHLISSRFKRLPLHASTQLTTHNAGQIRFLQHLSMVRVNLSRELSFTECKTLTQAAHDCDMEVEIFVHGANCISFSGLCYMSSVKYGNSGNRGRCSQPCREEYETTPRNKRFPLNLKDNCAFLHVPRLLEANVDSLKIEGRIKKSNYVYAVVKTWQDQLQRFYNDEPLHTTDDDLRLVYNRDFTHGFFSGVIHKNMFIDNPKDDSAKYLLKQTGAVTDHEITFANKKINESKKRLIEFVKKTISTFSIAPVPLTLSILGAAGEPLQIRVSTPTYSFAVFSEGRLAPSGAPVEPAANQTTAPPPQLNKEMFLNKFKSVNQTEYVLHDLKIDGLDTGLFIAYDEITKLKKQVLFVLQNNRETIPPVELQHPPFPNPVSLQPPRLSVLISSIEDASLSDTCDATFYFELPSGVSHQADKWFDVFRRHPLLTPWFPAVLIEKDYDAAVSLLYQLSPKKIVTNNLGIAHAAYEKGIPWVAGPFLNVANSLTLTCLDSRFNCCGAFLSNELSLAQLKKICPPKNIDLFYSIYHPILMLTSRQCLFHQVTGCHKDAIDDTCITQCEKSTSITNMNGIPSFIEKKPDQLHHIYFDRHYLNSRVATDLPHKFSSFLIDLKDVHTLTRVSADKASLIHLFTEHLRQNEAATALLHKKIENTTHNQYNVGI